MNEHDDLRDLFAAAALMSGRVLAGEEDKQQFKSFAGVAAYCYRFADAMLAEREKNRAA